VICRLVIAKQSGVFCGSGNNNGGNWVDGVTVYNLNNYVGSVPELDNADVFLLGGSVSMVRSSVASIGAVVQSTFAYNNPAFEQDFAENLDNSWDVTVTEMVRPNGLLMYNETWHRDGQGTVENANLRNTTFSRHRPGCDKFDVDTRFVPRTGTSGVVVWSNVQNMTADVDGTIYSLAPNTGTWQTHVYSGIGIYDIEHSFTATPTPDGVPLTSFQNHQIELNYWY